MEYRQLGQSNIKVSVLCLGTMTWGEQNTQDEAFAQLDMAIGYGVNFIDCAELYPVPPKAETYGYTETILGHWLKARANRDDLIIATKAASRAEWLPYIRDGQLRSNKKHLEQALNESLQRLQTDYIDLYQLHWPERKTNFFGELGYRYDPADDYTSFEETLSVLADFVNQGKVRHIGVSNETPWGIMRFLAAAENLDLPRMVSIQNPYSLLNRTFEIGNAEVAIREQVGLLAYSPLGFGVLSGKYLNLQKPAAARLTLFDRFTRYTNPTGIEATQRYVNLARQHQLDPAQMALAFVTQQDFLTANIIGATNLQQLESNLKSIELTLSEQVLSDIEQIHQQIPNPCP
ncbi:MAG: NADP(H)-dependent aldo-keto reductase [Gammaproteobacteria bacterium]|nr:NADP(H)-dependent aldo-keto reductase [Gammaproteobacteria bacterium]MDH5727519.1 NADP(H)-dependent aldo-keto reductase [Gammaproteobacteria bacterium]